MSCDIIKVGVFYEGGNDDASLATGFYRNLVGC